jgi:poly-beta-hydroxyalkanoate depolymerase
LGASPFAICAISRAASDRRPRSGHYATLLRGTIETLHPDFRGLYHGLGRCAHGTVIDGCFDVEDYYTDYFVELHSLGPGVHVVAIGQRTVPVLVATAAMSVTQTPSIPANGFCWRDEIRPRLAEFIHKFNVKPQGLYDCWASGGPSADMQGYKGLSRLAGTEPHA